MTGYEHDIRRWARCRCCNGLTPVNAPRAQPCMDIICPSTDAWEIGDLHDATYRCACGAVAETDVGGEPVCAWCAEHPEARREGMAAE
jgi:hypothetical protein